MRTNFWFLPSAMAAGAIALSFALIQVDVWLGADVVRRVGWLYTFGPEGARAILSAVASSMITVAGLTFSITMLTLQLASSQFGPRLLRNFMRDRGNQIVLGTFIATFAYCLLVLRTVRGTDDSSFVPHIAVAFGVLLAITSLAVLIYFIHHIAVSIRIETLLAQVASETREVIDHLYPKTDRDDPPRHEPVAEYIVPRDFEANARTVLADSSGYIQRADVEALIKLAAENDLLVRIEARPGHFVSEQDPLLTAYPHARISDEISGSLRGTLVIGQERTPTQDLEFSIRRIVEVAQRALSPGINDPTTAIYCLDRLGEVLGRLATRDIPSPMRVDSDGHLRVMTDVAVLSELACSAFAAIARYGIADADVIGHMLTIMAGLSRKVAPAAREAILALGEAIRRQSEDRLWLDYERRIILQRAWRT